MSKAMTDILNTPKDDETKYNYLFRYDNALYWTNGDILVRDDPNFAEYVKNNTSGVQIEQDKIYYLDVDNGNKMTHFSDMDQKYNLFKDMLKSASSHRKLYSPQKIEIMFKIRDMTVCGLFAYGDNPVRKEVYFVDKDYFDYISGIGYEHIQLNSTKSMFDNRDINYACFIKNDEVKSIIKLLEDIEEI